MIMTEIEIIETYEIGNSEMSTRKEWPIVAKLANFEHKMIIFSKASNLKYKKNSLGRMYFVSEHLPEEVGEQQRFYKDLQWENNKLEEYKQMNIWLTKDKKFWLTMSY